MLPCARGPRASTPYLRSRALGAAAFAHPQSVPATLTLVPVATHTARRARPVAVINPKSSLGLDLNELWAHRELLYILAWRDVKIRYKQTALGVAWAVIQPLLATAIFTVIFGRLAGMPSDGHDYALFAYVGFTVWTFFSSSVSFGGLSLVRNSSLISKVYFPRLLIPLASVLPGLVDLAIATGLLIAFLVLSGEPLRPGIALLPVAYALLLWAASVISLGLSALDVRYRDVRYAVPFLLQVWLYGSPIVYPTSLVPVEFRGLYAINPIVGIVEFCRAILLGGDIPADLIAISVSATAVMTAAALAYFRATERRFADVI